LRRRSDSGSIAILEFSNDECAAPKTLRRRGAFAYPGRNPTAAVGPGRAARRRRRDPASAVAGRGDRVVTNKTLTPFERHVIEMKGTEPPFSGLYTYTDAAGVYVCKRCETPLYRSEHKFSSQCGWPSFDDEIAGTVDRVRDADGRRTEILCKSCGAHLGHVFEGEGYTPKNIRHCVNSVSLSFRPSAAVAAETAVLASGCFWGTEYYLARLPGVLRTTVGYTGGHVESPTYAQVCGKKTGHYEAVAVTYDPTKVSYATLLRLFFETHDFAQSDGQGPDIGPQYRSAIFYADDKQRRIAEDVVAQLKALGRTVATELKPASHFWPAEGDHQQYYERKGDAPYCHKYTKIFPEG
jgi:peptide methionine sulfoxide reductase msrA/msrB